MMRMFLMFFLLPLCLHALILQEEIQHDLELLRIENDPLRPSPDVLLDVAIIGGGQAGMSVCFALQKQGIFNVAIFESAPENFEGCWKQTARMLTLRSGKESLIGLALGIPHLTFRAWYEAKYENWDDLDRVATCLWTEYLNWYKEILHLKVNNEWRLCSILPDHNAFKLLFNEGRVVRARKVVLATGRSGFGGFEVPSFIRDLPKSLYFHTSERIDPKLFRDKHICVVGAGASAFDIAATALESGAKKVDMLMRKKAIAEDGLFDFVRYWRGYSSVSDIERAQFFEKALSIGIPPPENSIERAEKWENFQLHSKTQVEKVFFNEQIMIQTNCSLLQADLIILATGYAVDAKSVPELSYFVDQILTWGDKIDGLSPKVSRFPYLSKQFQFVEKYPQDASYLKNLYCFNYGAFLSHGTTAGETDQVVVGAERVAEGIAIDFFLESFNTNPQK